MMNASTSSAPICSSCCMVSKEISLNSEAMPMNVSRRILAMFCSCDSPAEQQGTDGLTHTVRVHLTLVSVCVCAPNSTK